MEKNIEVNLHRVQARIHEAAIRSGKKAEAVRLVAISKGQPYSVVHAAYKYGLRDFGENRIAEAREKQNALEELSDVRWHMVGQIQSRKAKDVAPHFFMVHSVDRAKIAERLDRFAATSGKILPVLLECNSSGEASKTGWPVWRTDDWPGMVKDFHAIQQLANLDVRGLMTMAPWTADNILLRATFQGLRTFRDYLEDKLITNFPELSMGMTDDFEIAIEEGATIVRVGRGIFGPRHADE